MNTQHKTDYAGRDRSQFLSSTRHKARYWAISLVIVLGYGAWVGAQV